MTYNLNKYFCVLQKNIRTIQKKKTMETRIIKNIFNKNERRCCRDVKTQKACEQGWEANIGPKIKQTTSIIITLHKYSSLYFVL